MPALFAPHNVGTLHHRLHFRECDLARQVLHPAIGGNHDPFGGHVRQRPADARGDNIRCLAYCASKSAVDGITKALGCEWGETGITVNALGPTVFRSPLTAWMYEDTERAQNVR